MDIIYGYRFVSFSQSSYRDKDGFLKCENPVIEFEDIEKKFIITITLEEFCNLTEMSKEEVVSKIFSTK